MSKSIERFVVIAVHEEGGTFTHVVPGAINPTTQPSFSIEQAIKTHRNMLGDARDGQYAIYGMPLADFIAMATPEKREYEVTFEAQRTVRVLAIDEYEARAQAHFAATARHSGEVIVKVEVR